MVVQSVLQYCAVLLIDAVQGNLAVAVLALPCDAAEGSCRSSSSSLDARSQIEALCSTRDGPHHVSPCCLHLLSKRSIARVLSSCTDAW